MSVPHIAPPQDDSWHTERRKVRKGTHSCWECKRRKMKCRFDPRIASASCNGCRRRGSPCISQEFPESLAESFRGVRSSSGDDTPVDGRTRDATPSQRLTPVSTDIEHSQCPAYLRHQMIPGTNTAQPKCERLSRFLHGILPSRKDTESICKASRQYSILSHEMLTTPYSTLYQNGFQTPESLLKTPDPNMHPVLVARHMLQLALFLQHLHPDLHTEIQGLSEPPRAMMERLADVAIHHVTTNEEFIGSIESLECIMLESLYQVNIGNLRRSWVAGRRAMSVAQLMGFHRWDNQTLYKTLDPQTQYNTQLMWLRIVILDRHLCLLLGLPEGCNDRSMASETPLANDCPMSRLEHLHCVVMSRILERNTSRPNGQDLTATRAIDLDLQKAAGSLPSKWWLVPKLELTSADLQAVFWDTRRLVLQICHFNLLIQLHLPYMLRPSWGEARNEYSRSTCVNASREVLSRYISLRSFNRIAYSCRTVDFLALMAAMALLLAHMDGHRDEAENLLANQYLGDRGMIEQVQENMSEINRLNSDELSAQSAQLLRDLLAIDMDQGNGRVSLSDVGSDGMQQDGMGLNESIVRAHIPYFGVIRIAREDAAQHQVTSPGSNAFFNETGGCVPSSTDTHNLLVFPVAETAASRGFTTPSMHNQQQQQCQATLSTRSAFLIPPPLTQDGCPELTAPGEDWAFQGVDMAFFESMMRNIEGES